MKFRKVF